MRRIILITSILIEVTFASRSQVSHFARVKDKFEEHRQTNLQEKVFLHVDRNFYLTGETMWFKAYIVDGTRHQPLNISKVLYVELLDSKNNSLVSGKVATQDGVGEGSFFIPATLESANYTVRAYTEWMKNNLAEFYFHKSVTIVNPFVKVEKNQLQSSAKDLNVTLFPEGGYLISGIRSRVGIKVTDANGKGVNCKAAILNDANDTIQVFEIERFGLGSFYYTPSENRTERLIIVRSINVSTHAIPTPKPSGYVMHVTDSVESIHVNVYGKGVPPGRRLFLFAHARQIITYENQKHADGNITSFIIQKSSLAEGINHLTLFNESLEPICERLFFISPNKKLDITLSLNQKIFDLRKKVTIDLTSSAEKRNVPANLSIAVYKLDSLNSETPGIFSNLWLTSDLVGEIESPEYYFSNDSGRVDAIDNLMLTHGWRRFKWENVFAGNNNQLTVPEFRGHIVRAQATNAEGAPVQGAEVYLCSPGKVLQIYHDITNQNGNVTFETSNFFANSNAVIQSPDTTLRLKILSPFASSFSEFYKPHQLNISSKMEKALTERSVAMQVQDVYHEKYRNKFLSPVKDTVSFYGKADETYFLDDYTRFPVMEEVMREYVSGVLVRKKRDGFHFLVPDKIIEGNIQDGPLIVLDGLPIFDADQIMRYDPRLVKKIEVMTRPYLVGAKRFNGIIGYSTYQGDLKNFPIPPHAYVLDYEGLQLQREFFDPQYTTNDQRFSRLPDQRNLLYWAPIVNTNEDGKEHVEFFTSDLEGTYLVRVEGMSANGYAGSESTTFTVSALKN